MGKDEVGVGVGWGVAGGGWWGEGLEGEVGGFWVLFGWLFWALDFCKNKLWNLL